jgi:hypothetical protein
MTSPNSVIRKRTRRDFISIAGKSLGLAALSSATIGQSGRDLVFLREASNIPTASFEFY